jgi:hypothetical protein
MHLAGDWCGMAPGPASAGEGGLRRQESQQFDFPHVVVRGIMTPFKAALKSSNGFLAISN